MSIVDQYFNPKQPTPPNVGGGNVQDSLPADDANASMLERPVSMVGFVLPDGTQAAYPYATLLRIIMDRDRGIVLSFTADEMIVEGSGLEPLYKALTQHRVSRVEITAGERNIGVMSKDTIMITDIRLSHTTETETASL